MAMKTSLATRTFHATILFLLAFLSSTCAFFTDDIFPHWLSYVEASVDFRSIALANGLGDYPIIKNLEYAPFVFGGTDYSRVLVFASGNLKSRLFLLGPGKLDGAVALADPDFSRVIISGANGFICGTSSVDPTDYSVFLIGGLWGGQTDVRGFRVGEPGTGLNYAVVPNSSQQAEFGEYDIDWTLVGSSGTRNYDASASMYNLLDADYANGYSVLAQRQNYSVGYAASFATAPLFISAGTVFDSGPATQTGPFPIADQMAWITEGGPVAYHRSDKERNRLVRYKWGTGNFATGARAEEIDSLEFEDENIQILSFDPSGTWWFVLDRLSGRLYKLRTWWK